MPDDNGQADQPKPKKAAGNKRRPTLTEAKLSVETVEVTQQGGEKEYEDDFSAKSVTAEAEYTHLTGLQDHYKHKRYWSWFLMGLMTAMIIFQTLVIYKVGVKSWDYTEYKWLLPALLVQNLAQIVGLAVFVVKSLFANLDRQGKANS